MKTNVNSHLITLPLFSPSLYILGFTWSTKNSWTR